MSHHNKQKIVDEVNKFPHHVKAEVIAALLVEKGLTPHAIEACYKGAFMRPFRKDLTRAEAKQYSDSNEILQLDLVRNGVYDLLPEGACHSQEVLSLEEGQIKALTSVYRKRKQEEAAARHFFKPFENEFFRQLMLLEQKERALLTRDKRSFSSFLVKFWQINEKLTEQQTEFLIRFLPVAKKAKGDYRIVCHILSRFLSLEVDYVINYQSVQVSEPAYRKELKLGHNLVSGLATDMLPVITFIIRGIPHKDVSLFIEGGVNRLFIFELLKYVIPIEYEIKLKLHADRKPDRAKNDFGTLGYTLMT